MGHHLDKNGEFVSDKYRWCKKGHIALKFTDPLAQIVLLVYSYSTQDKELGEDIREAVRVARGRVAEL